jgi:hypothetical protein
MHHHHHHTLQVEARQRQQLSELQQEVSLLQAQAEHLLGSNEALACDNAVRSQRIAALETFLARVCYQLQGLGGRTGLGRAAAVAADRAGRFRATPREHPVQVWVGGCMVVGSVVTMYSCTSLVHMYLS